MSAARPTPGVVRAVPTPATATPATPAVAAAQARVTDHVERLLKKFRTSAQRVRVGADNDAIHDLRVATRRLIALLRLWHEVFPRRVRRDALETLRALRRRLGRAREFEVHAALLRERLKGLAEPERLAAAELLEEFERRRERRRASAARFARGRRTRPVREALTRGLGRLSEGGRISPELLACAALRVAKRETHARDVLAGALATHDDDRLHDARIAIKRWRYTAECGVARMESKGPLVAAQELQAALGELHDRATLGAAIEAATQSLPVLHEQLERESVALRASLPALAARAFPDAPPAPGRPREASAP